MSRKNKINKIKISPATLSSAFIRVQMEKTEISAIIFKILRNFDGITGRKKDEKQH